MQRARPPAVAGTFYPGDPADLREEVSRLLAAAKPGRAPKALIAPHAGYIYSGPIAASAFRRAPKVDRVVLLGPSHYAWLDGVALPEAQAFATPLGEVPIDAPADLPRNRAAHEREHSLEVEVPFLQVAIGPGFRLVPLAVGSGGADVLDRLWGGPETLIVVSSDLSHYLSYAAAKRADAATAEEIVALRAVESDSACGAAPVNALLAVARKRKLTAELLDLRNSGDTAGDKSRVVGYGAFAFYE
ncbi:MAG: AmmeMemoRadiSam system protein B [Myxococcales bacterium]|nr:AmmeMemoRadiSam system protein B [Myxococcales bacterium]